MNIVYYAYKHKAVLTFAFMALILLIDTSGATASVGIARGGEMISVKHNEEERNHAAVINLLIAAAMEDASVSFENIEAVAVCNGPGSYTGLRVGLATAKGICYVGNIPLLLHNKLEILALQNKAERDDPRVVYMCVLNARQHEYFAAAYNHDGKELLTPLHYFQASLDQFFDTQGEMGEIKLSTDVAASEFPWKQKIFYALNTVLLMDYWASIAENALKAKKLANVALSEPFYLKNAYTTHKKKIL